MPNFCAGPVSVHIWFPVVLFGAATALLLVWPRQLQQAYRRLATRFPRLAAIDPGRSLMSESRNIWILRAMGVVVLVGWLFLLAILQCWFRAD